MPAESAERLAGVRAGAGEFPRAAAETGGPVLAGPVLAGPVLAGPVREGLVNA